MKRFISLITIMALLLSFAVTAMAEEGVMGAPTEVASPQLIAGLELAELGIVQGYADGSLGLENTITRAELAGLIVKCTGLTADAEALKGSESKFTDVNASAWFAGLVNLSAEKGWITGDPVGTFRPNDPVQYREAITMIMRALGYSNENLGGQWPDNFTNKAIELGLAMDIELNSKEAALRGDVFVVVANTIDAETALFSKELILPIEETVDQETVETTPSEVEEEATEEVKEETAEEVIEVKTEITLTGDDNTLFENQEAALAANAIKVVNATAGLNYEVKMAGMDIIVASGALVEGDNDLSTLLAGQDTTLGSGTYLITVYYTAESLVVTNVASEVFNVLN